MSYLIKYTNPKSGSVKYFESETLIQFAIEHLHFHVDQREDDGWEVWLVGKNVAHYTNEWTYDEVIRDYFRNFTEKNNWKNIKYYKQI